MIILLLNCFVFEKNVQFPSRVKTYSDFSSAYGKSDNLSLDVGDVALKAAGEGPEQGMNKSKNEQKPADNGKGINDSTIVNKVKSSYDKAPVIESSKAFNPLSSHKREGYYGWIGNGSDEDKEYVQFPIPPLFEQIEKMIGQYEAPQSGSSRRRKSRWDEKPEGM